MSVQNVGHNRWRVVVKTEEILPSGKYRYIDSIIRGSKQDAMHFERACETNHAAGDTMTFGVYMKRKWLPSLNVADNTLRYYTQALPGLSADHPRVCGEHSICEIYQSKRAWAV